MFTLIHSSPARQVLSRALPSFVISFILAELFYKFHSFALECLAFLATWYVLESVFQMVSTLLNRPDTR
ncbi:hypothetical protein BH24DEI2_BH24DEI2_12760 [soil metagenome]